MKNRKIIEFQLNCEDKFGDIQDCDHRDTYKEAKRCFDENDDWTSMEKVTTIWRDDGEIVKRDEELLIG